MNKNVAAIAAGLTLGMLCLPDRAAHAQPAPETEATVLAVINGEAITSAELDAELIKSHTGMDAKKRVRFDYRKLLDKLINDRLLIQQAKYLEMDREEGFFVPLEEQRMQSAVRHYLNANLDAPDSMSDAAVREFFEKFYWRIQLRQVSARTREETEDLIREVRGGASMDSLCKAVSIDERGHRGGLHKLKQWKDVELALRDPSVDLNVGELSEPFAYRDFYSFVRVEERLSPEEGQFEKSENWIRGELLWEARNDALEKFVEEHRRRTPVEIDSLVLADIRGDSDVVFTGEFMTSSERVLMSVGESHVVTEAEFRKDLSHAAMKAATTMFDVLLNRILDKKSGELVIRHAAETAGWLEEEKVVQDYEKGLEKALIEAYLQETIVPQIKFNRQEFQEYYDRRREDFREAPEVRVQTLVVSEEEKANEAARRLQEGADFNFIKKQYAETGHNTLEAAEWSSIQIFSDAIQEELLTRPVGGTTRPFPVPSGWIVFRLKDRRPGRIRSLEEMDIHIRQVMFQDKFNQLMDEHLDLLKERSEVKLHQEDIEEYFGSKS